MNVLNANDLYNKSEDFKEYVDKYSTKHKISVNEALTHKLVQEVAKMYNDAINNLKKYNLEVRIDHSKEIKAEVTEEDESEEEA